MSLPQSIFFCSDWDIQTCWGVFSQNTIGHTNEQYKHHLFWNIFSLRVNMMKPPDSPPPLPRHWMALPKCDLAVLIKWFSTLNQPFPHNQIMWVHCAASPQHTVYLNLLIWPTLCQWFPLRWKQYHVNYHNHLVRAVKKSFLFLSQICTCQSKTASNKPLGLRNSREEPRSSLRGFRSGVKLIFSWQFDSPLSLCCSSCHKSLLILVLGSKYGQ